MKKRLISKALRGSSRTTSPQSPSPDPRGGNRERLVVPAAGGLPACRSGTSTVSGTSNGAVGVRAGADGRDQAVEDRVALRRLASRSTPTSASVETPLPDRGSDAQELRREAQRVHGEQRRGARVIDREDVDEPIAWTVDQEPAGALDGPQPIRRHRFVRLVEALVGVLRGRRLAQVRGERAVVDQVLRRLDDADAGERCDLYLEVPEGLVRASGCPGAGTAAPIVSRVRCRRGALEPLEVAVVVGTDGGRGGAEPREHLGAHPGLEELRLETRSEQVGERQHGEAAEEHHGDEETERDLQALAHRG